jgi:hypothetical protein
MIDIRGKRSQRIPRKPAVTVDCSVQYDHPDSGADIAGAEFHQE